MCHKNSLFRCHGCGQVVSVLAFNSDDPSLKTTEVYSFSVKFVLEKNENKQKEAGVSPFLKNSLFATCCGAGGRVFASDTRDPPFESSHRRINFQSTVFKKLKLKRRK